MDNRPIGVFDSGLGGLTAVKELIRLLPNESIVYFGDTGRVPYGTRGRQTIQKYVAEDIRFLRKHDVKMILVACGTASSMITAEMTAGLPIPCFTVLLPSAKRACSLSASGRIGVIATNATIKSGSYQQQIGALRPEADVFAQACPLFVPLVENGFIERDNQVTRLVVQQYLAPLKEQRIDTLILGCTHYPLLHDIISDIMGGGVQLVDSGRETARMAQEYLAEHHLFCEPGRAGERRFFVTDSMDGFSSVARQFLGQELGGHVHQVEIESL